MNKNSPVNTRWRQLLLFTALGSGLGLAHLGTSTMPFQIGALIDGASRSPAEAGLFGFFQVGALAMAMILISPWVDRISPRFTAIGGCLLAAVGSAGIFVIPIFPLQLAFGVLIGWGLGVVFAATIAAAAATPDPDRVYAIGSGGALVVVVGLMGVLPTMARRFGALGIFLEIAILATLILPVYAGFRSAVPMAQNRVAAMRTPGARGLLFSWSAFSIGTGALYSFSERIGQSIQLSEAQISAVLSAGVLIGLLGTGAAALLGRTLNRQWALMIGMFGSGLSCLVLGFAGNLIFFASGIFAYWICYMFLYSYLLGTAATLDPSGKIGTLGGGCERLGYALGTGIGGLLAAHATYSATGVLGFLGCALGVGVGFPSLFKVLGTRQSTQRAAPVVVLLP